METQQVVKQEVSNKTQELGEQLFVRAIKRLASADKTLNEEFSYKIAVKEGDSLSLNDANYNTEGKKTNNINVVVNSSVAKKQLKEIAGVDFDAIETQLSKSDNKGASAVAKLSLASTLKRFGKQLI